MRIVNKEKGIDTPYENFYLNIVPYDEEYAYLRAYLCNKNDVSITLQKGTKEEIQKSFDDIIASYMKDDKVFIIGE